MVYEGLWFGCYGDCGEWVVVARVYLLVALGTMEKRKLVYTSCGVGCVVTSVALDWKPKSKLSDRGFLKHLLPKHAFIYKFKLLNMRC